LLVVEITKDVRSLPASVLKDKPAAADDTPHQRRVAREWQRLSQPNIDSAASVRVRLCRQCGAGAPAAYAVDGDPYSAWNSGGWPPTCIELDLKRTLTLALRDGPKHQQWADPLGLCSTLLGLPTRALLFPKPAGAFSTRSQPDAGAQAFGSMSAKAL